MKHVFAAAIAAAALLAPLSANAQERMSDAAFLAANRCLAFAELRQLEGDGANFTALRDAAEARRRPPAITDQVRQINRATRARANTLSIEELRSRRNEACERFSTQGLVQLGSSTAS